MTLIRDSEREVVSAIAALLDCNPFLPQRLELERRALGDLFVPVTAVWHADSDDATQTPNAVALRALVERLGTELQQRLAAGTRATAAELADYEGLVLYLLFQRYENAWYALIQPFEDKQPPAPVSCYESFVRDVDFFFERVPGPRPEPTHLFALGFQARRTFHYTFRKFAGGSLPIARLRAAVWESSFTDDVRSYRIKIYKHMDEISTLIMGETGTGKELVARAVAQSRYIPFDAHTQTFAANPAADFRVVNLTTLNPALIEGEMFGYCKGAFTGADHDHAGWFETCSAHGTVFLDEIGELSDAVQVKLLGVLERREFSRVGETTTRKFAGKLISATNRELKQERRLGRFRRDLYYRICGDVVRTPTLREQLAAAPEEWHNLVRTIAANMTDAETAEFLAEKVEAWVSTHVQPNYAWLGNMRELEQCVYNILVRSQYEAEDPESGVPMVADPRVTAPRVTDPSVPAPAADDSDPLVRDMREGKLTAAALMQGYCARVYAQTGSYAETARRLDINRLTVRNHVRAWKAREGGGGGS